MTKILINRSTVEQALGLNSLLIESIDALRSALARQAEPVQEPVAWIQRNHLEQAQRQPFLCRVEPTQRMQDFVALYTDPPQRKPLTEEDIVEILCKHFECVDDEYIKRAAQEIAAHNIKENT